MLIKLDNFRCIINQVGFIKFTHNDLIPKSHRNSFEKIMTLIAIGHQNKC